MGERIKQGKIAFLFAGQGAQYPGMGRSLAEHSKAAAAVFEMADSLRPETSRQCFSGTPQELQSTVNTQPCVFTVDLAAAKALEEAGVHPDGAAGFSLGELCALTFSGAVSSEEGFRLVCARGERMQEAAQKHPGAMAAVLKLSPEQVEGICGNFREIWPVNYNCPGQIVVSGNPEEMDAFCAAAGEQGGRAKQLAVGGGFHSPYMAEASREFLAVLQNSSLKLPSIPVYANETARPYEGAPAEAAAAQIARPVRWQETLEQMSRDGFTCFIEVGPGKTLSGFVKRTLPEALSLHVEDWESLCHTLEELKAGNVL